MSLDDVLDAYASGTLSKEQAKQRLLGHSVVDAGCAMLDANRELRCGGPEVVYCEGKTPEQVAAIFPKLLEHCGRVLGTRAEPKHVKVLADHCDAHFDPVSRLITVGEQREWLPGKVVVVSAGTSDLPVAEEAAGTAEFLGTRVERHHDCGVAGIHRLLSIAKDFEGASAIIAVAGMEGALPSVVGGMALPPVIAVPTSVGYGASFNGLAALLAMMNSCAPGVGVVNIDNGFGAGFLAHKINLQVNGGLNT